MDHRRIVELATEVDSDFGRRIDFLLEIDQLKSIMRRSRITSGSRYENSAEHSWHLAMAAMIMAPEADPEVDIVRSIEILLVHDIVEIDAGDVFIYDTEGNQSKRQRELDAADRIFGLLPPQAGARLRALWDEYEERQTPTAKFAYALDRLQPLLLNGATNGHGWRENKIAHSQTWAVNTPIGDAAPNLWKLGSAILNECTDEGHLIDDRP